MHRHFGRPVLATALMLFAGGGAALSDVVAVVSAKSQVPALSRAQTIDLFLGNAVTFPDGSRATPIDQAEGSPARDEFYAKYAGKSPAQVKAHWSKMIFTGRGQPPGEAATAAQLRKLVADNPNAIGYLEPGQLDASVKVLAEQ